MAQLTLVYDMAIQDDGTLYFVDTDNDLIRQVTSDGVVSTLAGGYADGFSSGTGGYLDGQGTAALFNKPSGCTSPSTPVPLPDACNIWQVA